MVKAFKAFSTALKLLAKKNRNKEEWHETIAGTRMQRLRHDGSWEYRELSASEYKRLGQETRM